ncbi:MAG: rpe, Ribulose-phosphate 3-epimerase [Candidatus Saccharibacteria bacterium]|nr:rpe, Ribulose-phosphate 3-epimerase [Candidatus Saccharibacteria bacterium]
MSAVVCPTITAETPAVYRQQMHDVASFARRLHIDLADGQLAPITLLDPMRIWWPAGIDVDVHIMYQDPAPAIEAVLPLHPDLIIIHAESQGNFFDLAAHIHQADVRVGVALLQDTPVENIVGALDYIDHVLVFSGELGHFGGHVDFHLLNKVEQLRKLKPHIEIAWDGGINAQNARRLALGGVQVLNVGGYIHKSRNPREAYHTLYSLVSH